MSDSFENTPVSVGAVKRLIDSNLPDSGAATCRAAYEKAGLNADLLLASDTDPGRQQYLGKEYGNGDPITWGELLDPHNHSPLANAARTPHGQPVLNEERQRHANGFEPLPENNLHLFRRISQVASLSGVSIAPADATNAHLPKDKSDAISIV